MITLYTHTSGPNGWKIVIILEELGIPYESKYLSLEEGEHKAPEFLKINPNGRIPAIIDHSNDDLVLWESGAITQYLVDRYDKKNVLSFPAPSKEYYEILQWIAFQISGQGPYFGQATWFIYMHPESVPSAIERYQKEIHRVINVLDTVLSKQPYLVGSKPTVADLSFIPWNYAAFLAFPENGERELEGYVHYQRWFKELMARPAVEKAYKERSRLTEGMMLQPKNLSGSIAKQTQSVIR